MSNILFKALTLLLLVLVIWDIYNDVSEIPQPQSAEIIEELKCKLDSLELVVNTKENIVRVNNIIIERKHEEIKAITADTTATHTDILNELREIY